MKRKEAKGHMTWIDDECVGFKCECGEEIVVDIYEEMFGPPNKCPKCAKQYILIQSNEVLEVEEE